MPSQTKSRKEIHEELLVKITEALRTSDSLSDDPNDYYARCSHHLYEAFHAAKRME